MAYQSVFKRYELKYLLTQEQKERVLEAMAPYMELDKYGRTNILVKSYWITGFALPVVVFFFIFFIDSIQKVREKNW